MEYYNIPIGKNVSNLFTIILPWEKYCYKQLPMGISNPPDIFQHKMKYLFHGLKLSMRI